MLPRDLLPGKLSRQGNCTGLLPRLKIVQARTVAVRGDGSVPSNRTWAAVAIRGRREVCGDRALCEKRLAEPEAGLERRPKPWVVFQELPRLRRCRGTKRAAAVETVSAAVLRIENDRRRCIGNS